MEEQGLLTPQAVDLECVILGAVMLEKDAYDVIKEIIKPESFYKDGHFRIFKAVQSVASRNEPIDMITIVQELKRTGELELVGGAYYISSLTSRVASASNIGTHAQIVAQKYLQRELIKINSKCMNMAYSEATDIFELLDEVKLNISNLEKSIPSSKVKDTTQIVAEAVLDIKNAKTNGGVLGPSTGLKVLDDVLRGLRRTNVYVIAGRPAMGKSAVVVGFAKALCIDQNIPVGLFSLEMSGKQIVHRLLSDLSDIDNNKLASGNLSEFQQNSLNDAVLKITNNFHIDDTPSITIQYLESSVRRLVEKGVQYVIIDYLQLMELTDKDRYQKSVEQQIAFLSRNIKRIAKKYEVGIIELSQLSRKCEDRAPLPPRPIMSDLRDSGSIEQDADVVIFLYRPSYYNIEFSPKGKPYPYGAAELIIAKHRGGATESVAVRFKGEYTRFEDFEVRQEDSLETTGISEPEPNTLTF